MGSASMQWIVEVSDFCLDIYVYGIASRKSTVELLVGLDNLLPERGRSRAVGFQFPPTVGFQPALSGFRLRPSKNKCARRMTRGVSVARQGAQ
jgi:hypothetical protein